jgi:hypothetical protein
LKVLKDKEDARVALPSVEEIAHYQDMVRTNFLALEGS